VCLNYRFWPAAPIPGQTTGKHRHPANLDPFRPVATGSYREGRRVSDFLLKQSDEEFAKVNKSWRISLLPNKRHQTISNYLTVLLVAG
jgi:hypothetical protein